MSRCRKGRDGENDRHRRGVDSRPAALELQQTYEPIGGEMTLRTIGGSAIKQITWQKWRTTITGGGWLPFGLSSLDYSAQMAVACIVPRGVVCSGLSATLPAARRSDTGYVPWGVALMADQTTQITAATMAGNVATLDAVAGAIGYHAMYPLSCSATSAGRRNRACVRRPLMAGRSSPRRRNRASDL